MSAKERNGIAPNCEIADSADTSGEHYSAVSSMTGNEQPTNIRQLNTGASVAEKCLGFGDSTYSESDASESSIDDEIEIIHFNDTGFQIDTEKPDCKLAKGGYSSTNLHVPSPIVIDSSPKGTPVIPSEFTAEIFFALERKIPEFPQLPSILLEGKPYKCLVCQMEYSHKNMFREHMNSQFHLTQISKRARKLVNKEDDNPKSQLWKLVDGRTQDKIKQLCKKYMDFTPNITSTGQEISTSSASSPLPGVVEEAPFAQAASAQQAVNIESEISAPLAYGPKFSTFQTSPQLPTHQVQNSNTQLQILTARLSHLEDEFQNSRNESHQSKNGTPRLLKPSRTKHILITSSRILIFCSFLLMIVVAHHIDIFLNTMKNSRGADSVENTLPRLSKSTHDFISGYGSEKCIDIRGGSYTNSAAVIIWTCDAAKENQQWVEGPTKFISDNPKNRIKYRTLSARHSGKCLDVEYSETANNSRLIQYTCNVPVTRNQLFAKIKSSRAGYYQLKDLNSGKCVSVKGVSSAEGATLVIYDCIDGPNQQWVDI